MSVGRLRDKYRVEKTCGTCKQTQPIDDFWLSNKKTGLRQSECKTCMRARNNKWQKDNHATRYPQKLASIYRRRREVPEKFWFNSVLSRAKKDGLDFDLLVEDLIVPEFCPVLNIPLGIRLGWGSLRGGKDSSPSLDRLDNTRGYTADNVVIVSYRANRIKSDASIAELKRVADWYEKEAIHATISQTRQGYKIATRWDDIPYLSGMLSLPT